MIDHGPTQEWLAEPRTTLFFDAQGAPEGAFIQLCTGKIRKTEQPIPGVLVFLCWGFDGYPVAVKLLEPAPDAAQSTIVYKMLASRNGASGSPIVDLPIAFVDSAIHQLGSAGANLRSRIP